MFAALSRLARVPVTLPVTFGYGTLLAVITVVFNHLEPTAQDRVIRHTSTNLHNLAQGHLGTLVTSAFVVDADTVLGWLPGLMCLLAVAELAWGSLRVAAAFVIGHVGATILVAAGLTVAVRLAWLPHSISRADDVGMSYGAAAVLGAMTSVVTRPLRPAWAVGWLSVGAVAVWTSRDFTDVGHLVALSLGMVVATRFGAPSSWTAPRWVLLVPAVTFAYLLVSDEAMDTAARVGLAAALVVLAVGEALRRVSVRAKRRDVARRGVPSAA